MTPVQLDLENVACNSGRVIETNLVARSADDFRKLSKAVLTNDQDATLEELENLVVER